MALTSLGFSYNLSPGQLSRPSSNKNSIADQSRKFSQKWIDVLQNSFENRGHIHGAPGNKTFNTGLFDWQKAYDAYRPQTGANYAATFERATNPYSRSYAGRLRIPVVSSQLGMGGNLTWMKHPNLNLMRNQLNTGWMFRLKKAEDQANKEAASSKDTTKESYTTIETALGKGLNPKDQSQELASADQTQVNYDDLIQMFKKKRASAGSVRRLISGLT